MQELLESIAATPIKLAIEVLWVLGFLGFAFLISWWWGRKSSNDSLWFGQNIIDGILFPFVAFAFCYAASKSPLINQHMGSD